MLNDDKNSCSSDDDGEVDLVPEDSQEASGPGGKTSREKMAKMFRSLLDMMSLSSSDEIAQKLSLMSQSPPLCVEMREYGYLPLLIQLLHQHSTDEQEICKESLERTAPLRRNSIKALRNIINNTSKSKKEIKVLRLLEDLRSFVEILHLKCDQLATESVDHPCAQIGDLLKMSCEQEYKQIIEMLGGVYVIADVIRSDFRFHKDSADENCHQLYRYSLMTLTNMTFNNSRIKSLLGSMKSFINVLVDLLKYSANDELVQAVADIFRNLSWKTDYSSKQILRDVNAVYFLTKTALVTVKESTLKALLATLWNLTAHCTPNKADFCKVNGSIEFILSTLSFNGSSPYSLAIVESGGGILRNISSYVATNEEYRETLRKHNTIPILLDHLESSSLDVVSNACITLSNLSARSTKDQLIMLESGSIKKLRNLTNSKHRMIKIGASATLKNLLTSQSYSYFLTRNEQSGNLSNSFTISSSLQIRKIKAFKSELSNCLSESYDSSQLDSSSPKLNYSLTRKVSRSNSHDSIRSTHSEPMKYCTAEQKLLSLNDSYTTYYGQPISSMYATLPANSRICDKEPNDISSDYDICCGDANCQISISNSTTQSSFIDSEADPEPTDYSKRYKEHPIDDFTAPRSSNKETGGAGGGGGGGGGGCEDSVKIYQTEGTPLAFSLAPSLSDLRELDLQDSDCKLKQASPKSIDELADNFANLELKKQDKLYKKPSIPPKPKFQSTSAYNLKNLTSINEESFEVREEKCHNESVVSRCRNFTPKKTSLESPLASAICFPPRSNSMMMIADFYNRPWQPEFKRGQTVAAGSSKTSESCPREWMKMSLSTSKQFNKTGETKKPKTPTSGFYFQNDSAVHYATEDTPAIFSHATSLSSLTVDDNNEDEAIPANPCVDKEPEQCDPKQQQQPSSEEKKEPRPSSPSPSSSSKPVAESFSNGYSDDYDLLEACITSGMKTTSTSKNSKTPIPAKRFSKTKQQDSNSKNDSGESSGYFSTSSASYGEKRPEENSKCQKNSNRPESSEYGQECKVSSDDDDEILQKCIAYAMPVQKKKSFTRTSRIQKRISQQKESVIGDQKKQFFVEDTPVQFSECHSSLSSLSFDSADEIDDNQLLEAAINFGMNSKIYPPGETAAAVAVAASNPKSKQTVSMETVAARETPDDAAAASDDEKTYTICTKSSRSSKTLTSNVVMSDVSTVSSVADIESTNPPSLIDDQHLMAASIDLVSISKPEVKEEEENSLLENAKPPSIIDHSSLMSQSTASITSEISDIAFDQIPIRKSSTDLVATVASNCAKEINDLVQSLDTNTTESLSKEQLTKSSEDLHSIQLDKTFALEPNSKTLPRKCESSDRETNTRTYNKSERRTITNGQCYESDLSDTDISEVLPLDESSKPEVKAKPNIANILYNKPIDFESNSRSTKANNKIYPVGGSRQRLLEENFVQRKANTLSRKDESTGAFAFTTGNVLSQSLRRNQRFNSRKADFEDKDLMLTAHHKNIVTANHALFFQNKSNFKTASKYFDRHPMMYSELNHAIDSSEEFLERKSTTQSPAASRKSKSSILTNMKSKLTASLSSHTLGSANNSPCSSTSKSSSRKIEVKSKIASLWKRSKSTHDKLDQDSFTPNTINLNLNSKNLNRSISTRRSYTKMDSKDSDSGGLLRSSTYEKLPLNAADAEKMCAQCGRSNSNLDSKITGCICDNRFESKFPIGHYGSLNKKREGKSPNGHFTFTTFVKSIGKPTTGTENTNPLNNNISSVDSDWNNNNGTMQQTKRSSMSGSRATSRKANHDDSSSSSSSSQPQRKTCLVTTV